MDFAPGNFELVDVRGVEEARAGIADIQARVGPWIEDLVDSVARQAYRKTVQAAPNRVRAQKLVHLRPVSTNEMVDGAEAVVGVTSGVPEMSWVYKGHDGRNQPVYARELPRKHDDGSDPADFPFFMEVGTGIFGPLHHIITGTRSVEGIMAWGPPRDRRFARAVAGQRPRHYTRGAFLETAAWVPTIARAKIRSLAPETT